MNVNFSTIADAGKPLVSIVTPSFNQAPFIEQTIRSVLEQDYPNIEYIIIDGGSTDGSVDIIRRYSDRLAYWTSEPDNGQADAINKGWSRSSGRILAFLNSDDYYMPGSVRTAVAALQRNPAAQIVIGQGRWVTENGQPLQKVLFKYDGDAAHHLFDVDKYDSVPQPAAFVTRAVLDSVGLLDPSFHMGLDGEFFTRVLGNFEAVVIDDVLACLRLHPGSKSVAGGIRFAADILRVADLMLAQPHAYPRFRVDPRRVMSGAHIRAARVNYVNGKPLQALRHLFIAASQSPKYWGIIALRDLPRLVLASVVGTSRYLRLSSAMRGTA
jgi:glycosyltransferase involved in cell wall biosynthesis